MEKRDPQKDKDNVNILFTNELPDDYEQSQQSMLEPVVDASNIGFSKQELVSKKDESSSTEYNVPRTARLSLLREFDPLCECKAPLCKDTETIKEKAQKETLEDSQYDDFQDTASRIQLEQKLKADETTKAACICPPAKSSVSSHTSKAFEKTSEVFCTARPEKVIRKIRGCPASSEEIIRKVRYESLDTINEDTLINTDQSEIFYPTVDKREEKRRRGKNEDILINTDQSEIFYPTIDGQYFDSNTANINFDNFQSIHEVNEKSEFDLIRLAALKSISSMTDSEAKQVFSNLTDRMDIQQQELSELKLQLNAVLQAKAELELELTKKDEVILKSQAEIMKMEVAHKKEIKHLKEELKTKSPQKGGDQSLEEELKECKAREEKAIAELSKKSKTTLSLERSLDQYEKQLTKVLADHSKEIEEHEITKRHLVSLESAFSDVHCKYEKSKEVVQGYVSNEEDLVAKLEEALATNIKHEAKYESLKTHAKNQIDKCNMEILSLKERDEAEITKLRAIIKRLEIKCSSLEVSLQQKIEECQQLAALCDEVTGQKVS